MSVVGAASSPNLRAQQGCLQECPSFLCAVIAIPPPLFLLITLDMGSDIWVRPLGPIAPQGVARMHFPNVAEALRYVHSEDGVSLCIQYTQVARAAEANATRDGYAFTFDEPSSFVVAPPARPRCTAAAPAPNLSTFGFTTVPCACCGANICGTRHTCSRCHRVVDEACMQFVERLVQCFSCTCRAWPSDNTNKQHPSIVVKNRNKDVQVTMRNKQHSSRVVKKINSDGHVTIRNKQHPSKVVKKTNRDDLFTIRNNQHWVLNPGPIKKRCPSPLGCRPLG